MTKHSIGTHTAWHFWCAVNFVLNVVCGKHGLCGITL
ncbi:DUF3265 domain-containing protein [Aeromonas caviae]|nr:DUF3265 domain-containing protein [Aeromonas caviae]